MEVVLKQGHDTCVCSPAGLAKHCVWVGGTLCECIQFPQLKRVKRAGLH